MSDLSDLQAARSAVCAALAAWTYDKPSYSKACQSVQWTAHMAALTKQLNDLDAIIATNDGPWELETQGQ